MMMQRLPLDRVHSHPGNANVMPTRLFRALVQHMRETRRYPPLIVRPHAERQGHFQLLDGHHRATALREIGETSARCDIWDDVDDDHAAMLLLTLNRLEGSDDPKKRAALIESLCAARDRAAVDAIMQRLPDDRRRVERLRALAAAAPAVTPCSVDAPRALEPVTFFLSRDQAASLLSCLRRINPHDRAAALCTLVEMAAAHSEATS